MSKVYNKTIGTYIKIVSKNCKSYKLYRYFHCLRVHTLDQATRLNMNCYLLGYNGTWDIAYILMRLTSKFSCLDDHAKFLKKIMLSFVKMRVTDDIS